MSNVKLNETVYQNVHSVSMTTDTDESVVFPRYVVGNPIEVVLSVGNWTGTTYNLSVKNYKIGSHGVQVGLPCIADAEMMQIIIESALTIQYTYFTAATSDAAAYCSIRISAIQTPTRDITIALFGLEAV